MANKEIGIVIKVMDQATTWLKWVWNKLNNFAKKNEALFQKMAIAWGVAFTAISAWVSKTIDDASNLAESMNAVKVVFGEWSKELEKFGKTSAKAIWLSKQQFNEMAVPIGALLQNMGLWMREATSSTIELSKRAADMASIFNVSVWEALWAIQAWLRGEADPLERFWVWLNETAVKAYALRNWLIASWKEMTAQEKVTARLWLLYEQTAKYEWDFANTSDWLANSKRILNANIQDISATLWGAFLPIIEKVTTALVPIVNTVAEWINNNPQLAWWIVIAITALTWLVAVLWTLGLAIPAIVSWITSIWTAITFLWWPIWILIALIWVLAYTIYSNWDWIKQGTSDFVEAMGIYWYALKVKLETIAMQIKNNIWEILVRWLLALVTGGMSELLIAWAWWWDNIVDYVYSAVNPMVEWVKSKLDAITWFVSKIWTALSTAKNLVWGGISAVWNAISWQRAFGGTVQAGRSYLVWERWPEIITPSSTSRVNTSVWGGMNISVNMWGVTVNNEADENRLVDKITQAITRQTQLYQFWIN